LLDILSKWETKYGAALTLSEHGIGTVWHAAWVLAFHKSKDEHGIGTVWHEAWVLAFHENQKVRHGIGTVWHVAWVLEFHKSTTGL